MCTALLLEATHEPAENVLQIGDFHVQPSNLYYDDDINSLREATEVYDLLADGATELLKTQFKCVRIESTNIISTNTIDATLRVFDLKQDGILRKM